MNNIKVNANMSHEELIKELLWHDMKDCYRYKELLESEDVEVIKLAVELLTIDVIEKCQINRCREVFLHE